MGLGTSTWLVLALLASSLWGSTTLAAAAVDSTRHTLVVGAQVRSYLLHVPLAARTTSGSSGHGGGWPLVIALHGGGGNATQFEQDSGLDALADREGFAVAYPFGTGRLQDRLLTWNAGHCCGQAQDRQVDDVAFVAAIIGELVRSAGVDRRRVYVVGHSNGGMLAHRIGEALPDRVAAIVSVAGAYVPGVPVEGSGVLPRAVPVLHIHSVDDPRAPYAGGAPVSLHDPTRAAPSRRSHAGGMGTS